MEPSQANGSPLDQLEAQVNLVLEHTGRLFANTARSKNAVNNPLRLKKVIASANNTFHDALDELESELALARAVMRRDLAVYREKRGTKAKPLVIEAQALKDPSYEINGANTNGNDDIIMGDSEPEPRSPSPQQTESHPPEVKENSPLHLDIPGQDHQASGHPGDANTGTYSNFDFESLFNDPSSAGGATSQSSPKNLPPPPPAEPPITAPAKPEVTSTPIPKPVEAPAEPSKPSPGFEFTDLTNFDDDTDMQDTDMQDTDGISSLLPGLESYANSDQQPQPQPQNANADFNTFDAAAAGDFGSGANDQKPSQSDQNNQNQNRNQNQDQQQQNQDMQTDNRDTTFDDLMNFNNFDLGEFGGGEDEGGENKFDASFFDI